MQLKEFQIKAVKKAVSNIYSLLVEARNRQQRDYFRPGRLVLKSCTGSGKTIMLAEILRILGERALPDKYVFMWAAPNKLHTQSRKKLEHLLKDAEYNLVDIEDLEAGELPPKTILFANWEKLTSVAKKDIPEKGVHKGDFINIVVRRGEDGRNLQDILDETRTAGYKLILIADESHATFLTPNSQNFIDKVLQPILTIEASATPKLQRGQDDTIDTFRDIEIKMQDVIDSGLIKKQVEINPEIEEIAAELDRDAIRTALIAGLRKRDILEKEYDKLGIKINPLMLIQLPTESEKTSELDAQVKSIVEDVLADQGVAYYNHNLACWLTNDKEGLTADITKKDNMIEALIFKNAIALGWDCPRAQVLVMLRDIKSKAFQIQTVGRILRMPEAHHYGDDLLDSAYVYTNNGDHIEIDQHDPDGPNMLKYLKSYRRGGFDNIELPDSVYVQRADYGDLKANVKPILEQQLNNCFGVSDGDTQKEHYEKIDKLLEIYPEELDMPVISDVVIRNVEDLAEQEELRTINLTVNEENIEPIFDQILRGYCGSYKNFARSKTKIVGVLKPWFKKAGIHWKMVQRILVCSELNQHIFADIFEKTLDRYDSINRDEMLKRRQREDRYFDFKIPDIDEFSERYSEIYVHKNTMDPYYRADNAPKTEIAFEQALDNSDKVEWWYKNGEKMEKYFAVKYFEQDEKNQKTYGKAFYPDYIVRFTDERVGIFDTKSGFTAENKFAKQKAEALQRYIAEHPGLNLFGGLVNVDRGSFYLNSSSDYDFGNGKTGQWKMLQL